MFKDFIIKIKIITKTSEGKPGIKEVKAAKESIFKVAAAVEKFALDYGKQHLSDMKPSERFIYPNMGEVIVFFSDFLESISLLLTG